MIEAAIIGAVVAAVSPAVIVPRMIRLMEEGYGVKHSFHNYYLRVLPWMMFLLLYYLHRLSR